MIFFGKQKLKNIDISTFLSLYDEL